MTTSLGLGICLVMATASAVTDSAKAAEPFAMQGQNAARSPHVPVAPAVRAYGSDPLEAIVPVPAADLSDHAELQKLIITSIPMTEPPAAEGGEDEQQIFADPVEHLEFEEMRVPLWIVDTILRASKLTGADPVYMMALADKESSFIPANKASTSSAEGLFQFITSTWFETVRTFGPKHGLVMEAKAIEGVPGNLDVRDKSLREHILGLRRNPYIAALMAAELMQRDKTKIEGRLGRKLTRSEFYLSHFFGVDSASKFIALVDDEPKKSAPSTFPSAAKSNKSLFFTKDGKKTRELTVAEVFGKIEGMIDKRLDRYQDVSLRATADASF
ncbi:lytic transglycosylase domain-containing protein [Microvirga roseola]|uniref:lytic transglycosylase domain-containing protein n=1 Tax=Microvirga roseola TaxID=2883126 RepID=UPI001E5F2FD3|nr:lytic transglycosylase domain-containing protein [Microvirga roseola]